MTEKRNRSGCPNVSSPRARTGCAAAGLGLVDRGLEVAIFLAAGAAELGDLLELRLGLRQVVHLDIELAEILVGAAVVRFDLQRALVVHERRLRVAELAVAVAQEVVRVGVLRVLADRALEERHGAGIVLGVHRALAVDIGAAFRRRRGRGRPRSHRGSRQRRCGEGHTKGQQGRRQGRPESVEFTHEYLLYGRGSGSSIRPPRGYYTAGPRELGSHPFDPISPHTPALIPPPGTARPSGSARLAFADRAV